MSDNKFGAKELHEYRGTMICGGNSGEVTIHVDAEGNARIASTFLKSDREGIYVDSVHGSFRLGSKTLCEPNVVYSFGKPPPTGNYCPTKLKLDFSGTRTGTKISGSWSVKPLKESAFGKDQLDGRIAILTGTFVATLQ